MYNFIKFQKNGNRYYGHQGVTLKISTIVLIQNWAKSFPFNSILYDDRFVQILLVEFFTLGQLAVFVSSDDLSPPILDLIHGTHLYFFRLPFESKFLTLLSKNNI